MKCPTCGIQIPKLVEMLTLEGLEGYEVTKPIKAETYEEAKRLCPEGFRLPFLWEQFRILEPRENRELLSDGEYMFFWSATIDEERIRGLVLGRYLDLDSVWNPLGGSYLNGRVFFVREIKENK